MASRNSARYPQQPMYAGDPNLLNFPVNNVDPYNYNVNYNEQYPMTSDPDNDPRNQYLRDPTTISTNDIGFPKVLDKDPEVNEQTFYQVDIVNESLLRKSHRSELASKRQCLTRRWQTALVSTIIVLALAGGIGGLAYWLTIPKVVTQPFSLYGDSCYMNSRSCDATRLLWCPAGTCTCIGNFGWNSTAKNCSCVQYQIWTGVECQNYGSYGDPCNTIPCRPTLTCSAVINQTYSTGQSICDCDNTTYLETDSTLSTYRTCVTRKTYGSTCKTKNDCQNWLGLSCTNGTSGVTCRCDSTSYWNGTYCAQQARGGETCSSSVPCDAARGLTCSNSTFQCECDQYSYWDNVTTFWCQSKKTYSISCQYDFQCNQTVNLTCPSTSTGCNCPATSNAYICDCQLGYFWDGQRCVATHIFNGTCPGQYACGSNLVCYLGHCICPGNMVWNTTCACANGTTWNTGINTCI